MEGAVAGALAVVRVEDDVGLEDSKRRRVLEKRVPV